MSEKVSCPKGTLNVFLFFDRSQFGLLYSLRQQEFCRRGKIRMHYCRWEIRRMETHYHFSINKKKQTEKGDIVFIKFSFDFNICYQLVIFYILFFLVHA